MFHLNEKPRFLRLIFSTVHGTTRSLEVGYERLRDIWNLGAWFDGSSVPALADVNTSDLLLRPLFERPIVQPWDPSASFTLCGIFQPDGRPHPQDVREILKRVISKAAEREMKLEVGSELEFYLVSKKGTDITPLDSGGYLSTPPQDQGIHFRREAVNILNTIGIPTPSHHHEVGNGQHEIGIEHTEALQAADWVTMARLVISETAMTKDVIATFMPKPMSGMPGNGMHLHQSLWDMRSNTNLFASEDGGTLSDLAQHYIAGVLDHAAALTSLVASTVNSFRRLRPGFEAPTRVAWGPRNRTAMIRVPQFMSAKSAARIEIRCPDPLASPYLAIAAILAAGLDGIDRELEPPEPVTEDLFKTQGDEDNIPRNLPDALSALEHDTVISNALGRAVTEKIVTIGRRTWNEFRNASLDDTSTVTSWEIERYLLAV